jgi:glycerol-3-phosphate dehydrogenase
MGSGFRNDTVTPISKTSRIKTQVLIIGGGATGTGIARDLALRGVRCILADKEDINAGASGANHGLLHSGARYVSSDTEAARECREESNLLKRLAPHCIEDTGGLFVAVQGDDEQYIADFPGLCDRCGIVATSIPVDRARELEPELGDKVIAVFRVPDAAIDPFRLSLDNMADAQSRGALFLKRARVSGFRISKGRITSTTLVHTVSGEQTEVEADHVVNAAGAWAGIVSSMAGIDIPLLYSKGTLLVTQHRLNKRVINRLRPPTDADILAPGGTVSILGTTSIRVSDPDRIAPTTQEVDQIILEGAAMMPVLRTTRYMRAYAGVRPLFSTESKGNDREVSRGFVLLDHHDTGLDNFSTITGGKLSTFRLMAEKTADLVCQRLGIAYTWKTRKSPLPQYSHTRWTEPGLAPKAWLSKAVRKDLLLCECEMVPQSTVDDMAAALGRRNKTPDLNALALRSRIGKGPCQGAYCSIRVTAHLYNRVLTNGYEGLEGLKAFLEERWRGQQPMLWGVPLAQAELAEAIHCGMFSMENSDEPPAGGND